MFKCVYEIDKYGIFILSAFNFFYKGFKTHNIHLSIINFEIEETF